MCPTELPPGMWGNIVHIEEVQPEQGPDTIPLIPDPEPAQIDLPIPGLAQMTLQKGGRKKGPKKATENPAGKFFKRFL
ncbi:hypothetical protein Ddc_19227 [Ditylenchus destructor]|nr:hypothetical protein Ddc_19227 [Ditylenchus destructor]